MSRDWLRLPGGLGPPGLLVVGDVMLDRSRLGRAERVAAEAPGPVLRLGGCLDEPGGAARVALFARRLGAEVSLAGVVGDDPEAARLRELLAAAGVRLEGLVTDTGRPTTVKERVLAEGPGGPSQLLRLDRESRDSLSPTVARALAERADHLLNGANAVLVADHDKGAFRDEGLRALLRSAGLPLFADPAPGVPLGRYAGAEALLPNRAEAEALLGREVASPARGAEAAGELLARCGARAVLLKMDRDGLVLARRGAAPAHFRVRVPAVRGVAGAGDAVLAARAASRAAGLPWREASRLAWAAAGLLVCRGPSVPVAAADLAPFRSGHAPAGKVASLEALEALAEGHRRAGRTVVLTNGCFDLLHAGHLFCLEQAARLGDVLVVAVNSDAGVRRLKGMTRPVVPEAERAALLAGLACVSHVLVYGEDTPHEVIRRLRPDVLVKGGGYTPEQVVGRELVEPYGGRVCVTARREGCSTSLLVERAARRCLLLEDEAA